MSNLIIKRSYESFLKICQDHQGSFSLPGEGSQYTNGNQIFVLDGSTRTIYKYSLSTSWSLPTISFEYAYQMDDTMNIPSDIYFRPDGRAAYFSEAVGGAISDTDVYEYGLGTAWDVRTMFFNRVTTFSGGGLYDITGFEFKPDGTKMFVPDDNDDSIFSFGFSKAWDISSWQYLAKYSIANPGHASPVDLRVGGAGTRIYVIDNFIQSVRQYTMNTAWDLTSISGQLQQSVTAASGYTGIYLNANEDKLFLLSKGSDAIYQYGFSTPGDVTTISLQDSKDISNKTTSAKSFAF